MLKKYTKIHTLKIQKLNTIHKKSKQHKIQQNKTSLVQSPFTILGQKTRSTTLLSPHGTCYLDSFRWLVHCITWC